MSAVHASLFDASLIAPIRPKHPAFQRIQRYRSRFLNAISYQSFPHVSLKIGQFNGIFPGICPINVTVNPINCQSVRRSEIILDNDRALVTFVDRSSKIVLFDYVFSEIKSFPVAVHLLINFFLADVAPEDHPGAEDKV